jgi:hypothetical protein
MTDQPSLQRINKAAEKWRLLAEKRREDFAEMFRSGRWERYYELDEFADRAREVAAICDRWAEVVEQYGVAAPEPDETAIERDAA